MVVLELTKNAVAMESTANRIEIDQVHVTTEWHFVTPAQAVAVHREVPR